MSLKAPLFTVIPFTPSFSTRSFTFMNGMMTPMEPVIVPGLAYTRWAAQAM
jgi:hypothetical protein